MLFLRTPGTSRMMVYLLLTVVLISVEVGITHTAAFSRHPAGLSLAILIDLVLITTGLFYWVVARPLRLANSRLLLVAVLMLRIALFILPEKAFPSDKIWPGLLFLAEGFVLTSAIIRIRVILKTYRQLRTETDTETALRESLAVVMSKRVAGFFMGEGLTVYYVLFGWRLRSDIPHEARIVTTHRQSGQVALTVGLLLVGVIEGVVVHLLLQRWNPTAASWVTALSGYGMLFFIADGIATVKRPPYVTHDKLILRLGIRWRVQIACSAIAHISPIHEKLPKQPDRVNGAFLTAPNVLVTFREPIGFTGPYGIQKSVRQLSLFVDDRSAFMDLFDRILNQQMNPVNPVEKRRKN